MKLRLALKLLSISLFFYAPFSFSRFESCEAVHDYGIGFHLDERFEEGPILNELGFYFEEIPDDRYEASIDLLELLGVQPKKIKSYRMSNWQDIEKGNVITNVNLLLKIFGDIESLKILFEDGNFDLLFMRHDRFKGILRLVLPYTSSPITKLVRRGEANLQIRIGPEGGEIYFQFELRDFIKRNLKFLTGYSFNFAKRILRELKKRKFSDDDIAFLISESSAFIFDNHAKGFLSMVDGLRELDFSEKEINRLIMHQPNFFDGNRAIFDNSVQRWKNAGYPSNNIRNIIFKGLLYDADYLERRGPFIPNSIHRR